MTIGITIGKTIGASAAYAVEGAIRAGKYTGQFGKDVAAGTKDGYTTKREELAATRALGYTPVVKATSRRVKVSA